MRIISGIFVLFIFALIWAGCSVSVLKTVATIELKSRGYQFKDGWSPKPPTSKTWCKPWPEFGERAEYCELTQDEKRDEHE